MKRKHSRPNAEDVEENRILAAVGYIGILFLLPLFMKPQSSYCQYHARQGMSLFILEIIYGALCAIPIIGWFIIAPVGGFIIFILFIVGLANSMAGKEEPLPVIGVYGERF